jgi:hypothetical protein
MTKTDFAKIADEIKTTSFESVSEKMKMIRSLADYFEDTNNGFDRERFAEACFHKDDFMSKSEMRRITNQV